MTGKAPGGTSRKFRGVRVEVSGRGPRLLRSCLDVEMSIRNPSEANFLEVCLGTPQTSKKSLQKQFHSREDSKGASGGCLHGGTSLKGEKAHFAA